MLKSIINPDSAGKNTGLTLGFMLIILLALSSSLIAGTYSGGSGTSGDPYQISNTADLIELSKTSGDWSKYFLQTADISFNADESQVDWDDDGTATWDADDQLGFSPIGTGTRFSGNYDGNDKSISELYIDRSANDVGFFGEVQNGGVVQDLTLTNVDITNSGSLTGGLIGQFFGSTVSNCSVSGTVTGSSTTGGLLGQSEGNATIQSSSSSATVSGGSEVGGLIGSANGTITNCYATGNVTGSSSKVGGLFGMLINGVNKVYSTGNVTGTSAVGGLIGQFRASAFSSPTIQNSYAKGDVTRSSGTEVNFGGFCGDMYYVDWEPVTINFQNCYSIGDVNCGSETSKGFIGAETSNSDVTETYTNNFWDSEASNQSTAIGATAKTTAEMLTLSTFSGASWDIVSGYDTGHIWNMESGVNSGYPYLSWAKAVDSSLPVELAAFTAENQSSGVLLKWVTESEIENLGFILSRRLKAQSLKWTEIASYLTSDALAGHGSTTQRHAYRYTDTMVDPGATYEYRLGDVDYRGNVIWHDAVEITIPVADAAIPATFGLQKAYPNPFNPAVTLQYDLIRDGETILQVYNVRGQLVATPLSMFQTAGSYAFTWQPQNLNTGVYVVRLQSGKQHALQKVIFIK